MWEPRPLRAVRRARPGAIVALAVALLLIGAAVGAAGGYLASGGDAASASTPASTAPPPSSTSDTTVAGVSTTLGGTLTVVVAPQLKGQFSRLAKLFEAERPGWLVSLAEASPQQLPGQLANGAQADVYASGDGGLTAQLARAGAIDKPTAFASDRLVIVTPARDPVQVRHVDEIGAFTRVLVPKPGGRIDAAVRKLLARHHVTDYRHQRPYHRAPAFWVSSGRVDVAFLYRTQINGAGRIGKLVNAYPLPADESAPVTYKAAVVHGSRNAQAARWWIELLRSDDGRAVLGASGLTTAA